MKLAREKKIIFLNGKQQWLMIIWSCDYDYECYDYYPEECSILLKFKFCMSIHSLNIYLVSNWHSTSSTLPSLLSDLCWGCCRWRLSSGWVRLGLVGLWLSCRSNATKFHLTSLYNNQSQLALKKTMTKDFLINISLGYLILYYQYTLAENSLNLRINSCYFFN